MGGVKLYLSVVVGYKYDGVLYDLFWFVVDGGEFVFV